MSAVSKSLSLSDHSSENKYYIRRKRSFDDLLLPSLTHTAHTPRAVEESPYFFDARKKSKTAPASPSGLVQITPTTSPVCSSSNSLAWKQTTLGENGTSAQLSFSPYNANVKQAMTQSNTPLPQLKHLKLLPNPKVQEYSYRYPDTCSYTPLWKQNLTERCKETNYSQYQSIIEQVSQVNPRSGNLTHGLNLLADAARISSIISSPDEFYELSNTSNKSKVLVTPPSSPSAQFTSMISGSLVKAVKKNRTRMHKKTNSFKARKLKKLLDERMNLDHNDKFESQKTVFRAAPAMPTTPPHKKITLSSTPKSLQSPQQKYHPIILNSPEKFTTNKPISNSNSEDETDQDIMQASPKSSPSQRRNSNRFCVSCHCTDSPCWRPSWSKSKQDQLCNSCGLRYKKTHTRCTNQNCRKIPSKGELTLMKSNKPITFTKPDGTHTYGMACLFCGHTVATDE